MLMIKTSDSYRSFTVRNYDNTMMKKLCHFWKGAFSFAG